PGPRRRGSRASSWPHCTRDAEVALAERCENDQFALHGIDAAEGADVDLVGHEHQVAFRRALGGEGADLAGAVGLERTVAEGRVECRPGLGGAEGQARGLEAPAPLARQHAPDRDAARGERGAHAARLRAALLGEVTLGGAIAQAEARRVAERAVGRGVAHDDDLAAGAQEVQERLVGDGGARRQERQGREREDRHRAAHAAAHTVRTIFPNCLPSARRRWAAAPSLSGTISSTIALRRPAKNRRITSLNSRRFAMVEPMMWICFQKTIRMSVSAIGPVVAPHVTSRPPFRSDRSDCMHVWGQRQHVLGAHRDELGKPTGQVLAHDAVAHAEAVLALDAELAATAREVRVHAHAVADPETGHVGTDLGDVAGDVAAGPEGERGLERRNPLAHEDVQVVQRAGADADDHLSGSRLRVGDVLKPELLGTAELVEGERLHFDAPCPGFRAFTRTAMFPYGCLFSSISWWHSGMSSNA